MDLAPIIFGFSLLMTSITSSSSQLYHQARRAERLSHNSKEFNCPNLTSLLIESSSKTSIKFYGDNLPCMLPNLYKDDIDQAGAIDRLFDEIIQRCREDECS